MQDIVPTANGVGTVTSGRTKIIGVNSSAQYHYAITVYCRRDQVRLILSISKCQLHRQYRVSSGPCGTQCDEYTPVERRQDPKGMVAGLGYEPKSYGL